MSRGLLLATTSPDKVRELRELLAGMPARVATPAELGLRVEVEETGSTFRENVELKARAYHAASGWLTLAEDAGLEVEALGGAPGVQSARWEGSDYERKNRLLVERLAGLPLERRRCRYVSELALVDCDGSLYRARGTVAGTIAWEPRGSGGFGYDPIFYLPELGRTMAELNEREKNALSHRGQALRRLLPVLQRLLAARP
ncbi:MAG: RdgB/HAM1 family non-canonical purine NTP pyrophosphatase [Chloroflexi bacterium]|nr:RdgB/HAM1 family non-canonical purine NTP pyrophosphatase [Chloroflexota bacterium]